MSRGWCRFEGSQIYCRSWLVGAPHRSEGGLTADLCVVDRVHIRCCGNGGLGFRPYGESLLSNATKGTKRSRPGVRPLAKARGSFTPVSIRGHCPPVGFASTYMQRVRLRRTALRATPRMNTSTQPSEGAGGSRSKAAGELTLGLMSGEERGCGPCFSLGTGSSGRRIAAKAA